MGPRTVSGQPASVPALDSPQDPALRYVLAVGAVSAGLPLSDAGHDGDTGLSLDVEPVVSDARARMVARGWGIEPVGEPGKAGGWASARPALPVAATRSAPAGPRRRLRP